MTFNALHPLVTSELKLTTGGADVVTVAIAVDVHPFVVPVTVYEAEVPGAEIVFVACPDDQT